MRTDAQLRKAAKAAGILTEWQDVHGKTRAVGHETLRALLGILGTEAPSTSEPPLITAEAGASYTVPGAAFRAHAPKDPGYYPIKRGKHTFTLAVAPSRRANKSIADARGWGLSVQLYSLYRKGDGGIGTYGALRDFMRGSGEAGAGTVAVSPIHAQFSADLSRFSPYSPSSRLWMNALHIDVGDAATVFDLKAPKRALRQGAGTDALIAWPEASRGKLKALRALFDSARKSGCFADGHPAGRSLAAFRRSGAASLLAHATFEALHAHFFRRDRALWNWADWPSEYRDPNGAAVRRFAKENREAVDFHIFLQWLAARQFRSAADAGGQMALGIIKDIAVGADGGGSEAWSNQGGMLTGAAIGAPPDAFNTLGQNWGVTTFSPNALSATGYQAFIQLLRSALQDAGGIRIDHVLGLRRLWVVPSGADAQDGAYIRYPLSDLLRLTALEAHRAGAVVLGEDLGTVPEGFREQLDGFGIKGMQVLWFERQSQRFLPPRRWRKSAVGMTTTHDLPTVAGWWLGKDIAWRKRLKLFSTRDGPAKAIAERKRDRAQLWAAFLRAGVAEGRPPGNHDVTRVLAGAIDYLGRTECDLVVLPLEDALGRKEQPNLPGTIAEHPNWRRRILIEAGEICRHKQAAPRLRRLAATRAKS
jgi:4-alpha-glucanotransferase